MAMGIKHCSSAPSCFLLELVCGQMSFPSATVHRRVGERDCGWHWSCLPSSRLSSSSLTADFLSVGLTSLDASSPAPSKTNFKNIDSSLLHTLKEQKPPGKTGLLCPLWRGCSCYLTSSRCYKYESSMWTARCLELLRKEDNWPRKLQSRYYSKICLSVQFRLYNVNSQ